MSDTPDEKDTTHGTAQPKPQEQEIVEGLRTNEPQAAAGEDAPNPNVATDKVSDDMGAEEAEPGISGYGTRDPESDMPMYSANMETQDDPKSHDAAPDNPSDRDPSK